MHVYLTKDSSPNEQADVENGFVDLGKVAANNGTYDYPIPASTTITTYKGAIIYCAKYYVIFGKTALTYR